MPPRPAMLTTPHPPPLIRAAAPWSPMVGHALTVISLALGGLSSFHALRAEVVELRSNLGALVHLEAEHNHQAESSRQESERRRDGDWRLLRDELRELRAEMRDLKQLWPKGEPKP